MKPKYIVIVALVILTISIITFGINLRNLFITNNQSNSTIEAPYISGFKDSLLNLKNFYSNNFVNITLVSLSSNTNIYMGSSKENINLFSSNDLTNWSLESPVKLLNSDQTGRKVYKGSVIKVNDKYYIYYENSNFTIDANNKISNPDFRIYRAESSDAQNWTNITKIGDFSASKPTMIYKDSKYHLFYYREDTNEKYVYYATSSDGLNFNFENNQKPILTNAPSFDVTWLNNFKKFLLVSTGNATTNKKVTYLLSSDGIDWSFNLTKNNTNEIPFDNFNLQGGIALLRQPDGTIVGDNITIAAVNKNSTTDGSNLSIISKQFTIANVDETNSLGLLIKGITSTPLIIISIIASIISLVAMIYFFIQSRRIRTF